MIPISAGILAIIRSCIKMLAYISAVTIWLDLMDYWRTGYPAVISGNIVLELLTFSI